MSIYLISLSQRIQKIQKEKEEQKNIEKPIILNLGDVYEDKEITKDILDKLVEEDASIKVKFVPDPEGKRYIPEDENRPEEDKIYEGKILFNDDLGDKYIIIEVIKNEDNTIKTKEFEIAYSGNINEYDRYINYLEIVGLKGFSGNSWTGKIGGKIKVEYIKTTRKYKDKNGKSRIVYKRGDNNYVKRNNKKTGKMMWTRVKKII